MEPKKENSFWKDYLIDTAAGTVSGAGVASITHPLDTQTVRAQADSDKDEVKGKGKAKGKGKKVVTPEFSFSKFKTPKGREALKTIVKHNYKGFVPRLKKTMVAGAIGYPLFTGSKKIIEGRIEDRKEKEKTAGVGTAAGFIAKKMFSKSKGGTALRMIGGGGLALGASKFLKTAPTTLEEGVRAANRGMKHTPKVNAGSNATKATTFKD